MSRQIAARESRQIAARESRQIAARKSRPRSACRAWIDGAARGNPGDAGFGLYFVDGDTVEEIGGYLGRATNNVAEYTALIAALAYARQVGVDDLTVYSDSQLMVRQINGQYRVKASHLRPYYLKALELKGGLERFAIEHVRRENNRDADRLANRAVDNRLALPSWLVLPG